MKVAFLNAVLIAVIGIGCAQLADSGYRLMDTVAGPSPREQELRKENKVLEGKLLVAKTPKEVEAILSKLNANHEEEKKEEERKFEKIKNESMARAAEEASSGNWWEAIIAAVMGYGAYFAQSRVASRGRRKTLNIVDGKIAKANNKNP